MKRGTAKQESTRKHYKQKKQKCNTQENKTSNTEQQIRKTRKTFSKNSPT